MPLPTPSSAVADDEVFVIADKGSAELKKAEGTALSAMELQVLVLVDAVSTVAQIAERLPNISREEVNVALRKFSSDRPIVSTAALDSDVMGSGFSTISVPAGFFSSLIADSNPEADGGMAILKKKGYYVRIARRPVQNRERKEGWQPTILVVDDDPDLQKLIRTFLKMEGFNPRAAFKRNDIPIALRQQPTPDLILLDVVLPDANGFEILAAMRLHPALKSMPVIMLTAEATREAVLKGLRAGADGYVTKPFEPDSVVTAVKAVLGLLGTEEKR
jgi:two-component system OmpR family response regulator